MAKKDVWTYNFAQNAITKEMARNLMVPKVQGVRDQRLDLEEEWIRYFHMWNVEHDDNHMYLGRAKLYVPEVRKCIEAQARQFCDLAFPTDDFIECYPMPGGTSNGADVQKSVRRWQIEQSNLKGKYLVFARQQIMLGTSPARVTWDKKSIHAFKQAVDKKTGKISINRQLLETVNSPTFTPVDLFKWYAMNSQSNNFQDDGCFEVQVVNREYLDRMEKMGLLANRDDIDSGNSDAYSMDELEKDIRRAESLGLTINANQGYQGQASLKQGDENRMGTYELTSVYANIICPEACLPDEDPETPIPMKIDIYNNEHVAAITRNPFYHQMAPYVVGKYIYPNADFFYGQGIPKAVQYQQYELNSTAEQTMDAKTMALNPIAMIDPAMAAQNQNFEIEPNAVWYVAPTSVRLDRMPDVSGTGYAAMSQLRAQIQDFSDREPSMPSQLSGKARTATAAAQVGQAMSVDMNTFKRQNEQDVLIPLMQQWESLTDQHSEDEFFIMILGRDYSEWKNTLVKKESFAGNYKYMWKVSSDQDNKQVKARQIIDMMKVAGSLPPDQQQKLNFNFAEATRILWKEVLRLPSSDKIIPDPLAAPQQDPEVVYRMIELGMDVEVLATDNNQEFLQYYNTKLQTLKKSQDWLKEKIIVQMIDHKKMLDQKLMIMQQMKQEQAQQMQLAMAHAQGIRGTQPPQPGQPTPSGTQGSGNRTQLSPNADPGALASGVQT